jgi:hypothetical protein
MRRSRGKQVCVLYLSNLSFERSHPLLYARRLPRSRDTHELELVCEAQARIFATVKKWRTRFPEA